MIQIEILKNAEYASDSNWHEKSATDYGERSVVIDEFVNIPWKPPFILSLVFITDSCKMLIAYE
jgi:hypothetical protein